MHTVTETSYYTKSAEKLLSQEERQAVIDILARTPEHGDVIRGTSGVRKMRIAASGRGKRGGGRVIYYYESQSIPVLALAVYAKNTKDDMSAEERSILADLAKRYSQSFKRRK